MTVYIVMILLSLVTYKLFSNSKRKVEFSSASRMMFVSKNSAGIWFAAFFPFIVAAIRYNVGTDYMATYQSGFLRILRGDYSDGFEICYFILNIMVQKLTTNPQGIFVVSSAIFVFGVYRAIYQNSVNIPLSILIFFISRFYFMGMNCVRQFIALAIVLYSTKYIFNQNFVKFFCLFALAVMFHSTVLIFFPAYFLYRIKLSNKIKLVALISTLFVGVSFRAIVNTLLNGTKYQFLMNKFKPCGVKFTIFTITFNLLIFLIYEYYLKEHDKKIINLNFSDINTNWKQGNYYRNIQFISLLITFLLQTIPLVERLYWTYSITTIFSLPYFLELENNKIRKRRLVAFIFFIYVIYFVYDIIILKDHEVLPYQTILRS